MAERCQKGNQRHTVEPDRSPSQKASEALVELATGGKPRRRVTLEPLPVIDSGRIKQDKSHLYGRRPLKGPERPFEHPDAKRRFRLINTAGELQRVLDYPSEKWTGHFPKLWWREYQGTRVFRGPGAKYCHFDKQRELAVADRVSGQPCRKGGSEPLDRAPFGDQSI